MAEVPELTPTAFHERWGASTQADVVLLDVREPEEVAIASLPEALHIPMNQLPGRVQELDPARPVVVMCHSGGRSRRVAQFLCRAGFSAVFNLKGGIDAWSLELDPRVPRY